MRFASVGSIFSVVSASPSASSSSDWSPDDPLVIDFICVTGFLGIAGREGTPIGTLVSLSWSFDKPGPAVKEEIQDPNEKQC